MSKVYVYMHVNKNTTKFKVINTLFQVYFNTLIAPGESEFWE